MRNFACPTPEAIDVSPEMIAWVGRCDNAQPTWDEPTLAFLFDWPDGAQAATLTVTQQADVTDYQCADNRLILFVCERAALRIFSALGDNGIFLVPPEIRSIVQTLVQCDLSAEARTTLRLAKSIELLCETMRLINEDMLIPANPSASLSYSDCQRIFAARQLIEQRWAEKLTLDSIAAECGLNRSKLARGFRDLFSSSVADSLCEQRLSEARKLLAKTELPVSSVGYRCGYLNNASFARAFARRYGVAPSSYRAGAMAA